MIDLSNKYWMQIEPDKDGEPIKSNDHSFYLKVAQIFNLAEKSKIVYKGFHRTTCGKRSDNMDHVLPNGMITNSLCVYYAMYYRHLIPESEIEKTNKLYAEFFPDLVEKKKKIKKLVKEFASVFNKE